MDESRRPRRPGRLWRRSTRQPVEQRNPDDLGGWPWGDEGGDGSAGVREPRRPKPLGPMSDAGEAPLPPPPLMAHLPDPRY
jgi:hypothetical protein